MASSSREQKTEDEDDIRVPKRKRTEAPSEQDGVLLNLEALPVQKLAWRKVAAEGLDLDYTILMPHSLADDFFKCLENEIEYFTGDLTRIKVYGKWHQIPRQQVSYGDEGLVYKFSGTSVPARPWHPALAKLRGVLHRITGHNFNFVLVNRYRDGKDRIGEHRDDEKDLDHDAPIASVSLGEERQFVLRHRDARKRTGSRRDISPVKMVLEHGSLLMMNPPTNKVWYHSLPTKKNCNRVRVNLTFRKIICPSPSLGKKVK